MSDAQRAPRLSLGLPVYNGERFLAQSLDALLVQTFTDFELIISDNASDDATEAIARRYAEADPRVRYVRQARNLGSAENHNVPIRLARGELFKWVSDDDLYAPDLIERCVQALDDDPDVVCAHSWTSFIDEAGTVTGDVPYLLRTADPSAPVRFRSLLYEQGGDDIYGVIRMSVLRRMAPFGSHHMSDRTFVAELALYGPFFNIPERLYFRRDHDHRTDRVAASLRLRCAHLDPRRADRLRHPTVRLVGEYLLAYVSAIRRAPLAPADKARCLRALIRWTARHVDPGYRLRRLGSPDPAVRALGARS